MIDLEKKDVNAEAMEEEKVDMKGRKIADVDYVQVTIAFPDNACYEVPLTELQRRLLLNTFGFKIDEETGELTHYTDGELNEKYKLGL